MKITAIKTEKIAPGQKNLFEVLDEYLITLNEKSIIVITSKIVSICEGSVVKKELVEKHDLIKKEADSILHKGKSKYHLVLTMKNHVLIPTAGIDESNGAGHFVLWPKDVQKSTNEIRSYLIKRFGVKEVGIIITDSKSTILRRGTTGWALAHSGFLALKNYIGKPDIFGNILKITKSNIMDALASAAVVTMGEGQEQTPIAVIEDIPFVEFQIRDPNKEELGELMIEPENDFYAPLFEKVEWDKKETVELH